ncbi:MAG: hypothetical protein R3C17_05340 [Planctomycetaceae bacterium]
MAKSKGFDFKALLLNHGEKFVVSLVALLGASSLATASWSTSDKQPDDLKKVAESTKSSWLANAFTDEKKAVFDNTPDVLLLAERMQSETEDLERFSTLNPWDPPINPVRERRGAVTVLTPIDPEANAVAFVMAEKPNEADLEAELAKIAEVTDEKKEPEVSEEVADIFGVQGGGLAGPGVGLQGAGAGAFGNGFQGLGGRNRRREEEEEEGTFQAAFGFGANGYGASAYGNAMSATMERKVHYHSGVSVRMIFPLLDQIRSAAEALHLPQNDPQVAASIDFIGFEIQRKKAVPGANPWSGEWESISTDEIGKVLETSLGFDLDVVNPGVTRSELTMPLPRLAAGKWTLADASHKMLDDFKLDDEEQQLVDRYQAKLLEEIEARKKLMPELKERGGFSRFMLNGTQLNQNIDDDESGNLTDQLYTEFKADRKDATTKSRYDDKEELKKLINRSMATGRVLLVRFMDLTCDRGNTYIYRVRLEMKNPNFGYPVDELEQPELATQETIFSDWSPATAPTYVPQSYRYYTRSVDNPQWVKIGMFYENEKAGTPVMANLDVRVGSRIGGKTKVEVVDLSEYVLEPQDVEIKSPDLLAAVAPSVRLNSNDSPELKSYIDSVRGRKQLADRITVVDNNGAIITRYVGDAVSNGGQPRTEDLDSKFYQDILKLYEHLKYSAESAAVGPYNIDDEDGGGSGNSRGLMGGLTGGGGYGGGMRKGNALSGGGRGAPRKRDR